MDYQGSKYIIVDGKFVWDGTLSEEIEFCRKFKSIELLEAFNTELECTGTLTTSEGWVVDARRKDLDNLKNLYEHLLELGATEVPLRMYDNSVRVVPISRLAQLCSELRAYGVQLYQKKWAKESELAAAQTVAQVQSIHW